MSGEEGYMNPFVVLDWNGQKKISRRPKTGHKRVPNARNTGSLEKEKKVCPRWGSNPRPPELQSGALTN